MTIAAPSKPSKSAQSAVAAILFISAAATLFILWLVYKHPAAASSSRYAFLPAMNALFNGLSAVALLIGFTFIRAHKIAAHRASMIAAFTFSSLFLVGYLLHHYLHGEISYPKGESLAYVYFPLLISHIVLAALALPLILITFFFSLTRRFAQHKKIARWTFPLWLYVSVTGVLTWAMLRLALSRG